MDGHTAVITGGTRGIGRAVAAAFAEAGATVVIAARDGETLDATPSEIDGDVTGVRADVRDEYDVERLVETASRAGDGRGIDTLVANAAVYHGEPGSTPITEESYSSFDDHARTNGRGVFATIREALPHLTDDARVLVSTGSVARDPKPGIGSYAVSKATAEAIARAFAVDTGYVVGCVDPGMVETELSGPGGRDPDDVAPLFLWAATEADPESLDGDVVGLREWKTATR